MKRKASVERMKKSKGIDTSYGEEEVIVQAIPCWSVKYGIFYYVYEWVSVLECSICGVTKPKEWTKKVECTNNLFKPSTNSMNQRSWRRRSWKKSEGFTKGVIDYKPHLLTR